MLQQFFIDEQYICDVVFKTEYDFIKDRNNPTPKDLITIIKGYDRAEAFGNKDHDEFTKLRQYLEDQGYIKTERGWWNGDRVLKPFMLNEWEFLEGSKFPCAAALRVSIDCARKAGRTWLAL